MSMSVSRAALGAFTALALSLSAVHANATGGSHGGHHGGHGDHCSTGDCDGVTKLTFSEAFETGAVLKYNHTVGGKLTISASGGSPVIVLGELGVASLHNWDSRLGQGETLTFTFQNEVQLAGWDLDDLNWKGSNTFSLAVDGNDPETYSLDSFGPGAGLDLIGTSFVFAYSGDSYYIDKLTFKEYCPTPPVPEPETYGLALAGLLTVGAIARRRRAA